MLVIVVLTTTTTTITIVIIIDSTWWLSSRQPPYRFESLICAFWGCLSSFKSHFYVVAVGPTAVLFFFAPFAKHNTLPKIHWTRKINSDCCCCNYHYHYYYYCYPQPPLVTGPGMAPGVLHCIVCNLPLYCEYLATTSS